VMVSAATCAKSTEQKMKEEAGGIAGWRWRWVDSGVRWCGVVWCGGGVCVCVGGGGTYGAAHCAANSRSCGIALLAASTLLRKSRRSFPRFVMTVVNLRMAYLTHVHTYTRIQNKVSAREHKFVITPFCLWSVKVYSERKREEKEEQVARVSSF
jgi:hypothetical protein